jgi:hypothetical protein
MAAWRLDVAGRPVVGYEDALPEMRAAISSIVGHVLTEVQEDADYLDVVFHFGGVSIKVFPVEFASGHSARRGAVRAFSADRGVDVCARPRSPLTGGIECVL